MICFDSCYLTKLCLLEVDSMQVRCCQKNVPPCRELQGMAWSPRFGPDEGSDELETTRAVASMCRAALLPMPCALA